MAEKNRTEMLIDYLFALSHLKRADYFANIEIAKVIAIIEQELRIK